MPFTPAHSAIVLPLLKSRYFSATGLIVGSVSPDFEYFFKASASGVHGHTALGLFYFDLPVCFILAFTFHGLVKDSLMSNIPVFLQSRLVSLRELNFLVYLKSHWLIFIYSALLGAFSHIFWDSFTHNNRYFVNAIPILRTVHIPLDGARYPLWYVLQHVSTLVGLAFVMGYVFKMPSKTESLSTPKYLYWVIILVLSVILFYLRFHLLTIQLELGNVVVTAMSAFMLAMCLVSVVPYFKSLPVNKR